MQTTNLNAVENPQDNSETLRDQFEEFIASSFTDEAYIRSGTELLSDIRNLGRHLVDKFEREKFAQMARDISERLFELTGEYSPARLEPLDLKDPNIQVALTRESGSITGTNVIIYQQAPPKIDDPDILARASQRLAELPTDFIPDSAPLPPGSRMPFSSNPLFVDREVDLLHLAKALKKGETAIIGQGIAITGLGGIGKSQLASEFVHRYGQYFAGGVFWLNFADAASVLAEVAACGGPGALDLRADFDNLSLEKQARVVMAVWQQPLPRLLIFDNCESETLLTQWRPSSGGCRILLTSRRAEWNSTLGVFTLPLAVLPRTESIALLRKHRPDLLVDDTNLDAIAAELGDLPLALHLAGNYLTRYRHVISPAEYLAVLRDKALLEQPSLQAPGDFSPTGHDLHIGRTFALSYEKLQPDNYTDNLARALLSRAAHFAPGQPIPRKLLIATLSGIESSLQDQSEFDPEDAIQRLVKLGLIDEEPGGPLRLHRLLAAFVRGLENDLEAQVAVEETLLKEATHLNRAGYPSQLRIWQSHLRAVTDAAKTRTDVRAANLCNAIGYHFWQVGDYVAAQFYLEQALAIDEIIYTSDNPNIAIDLNNLALLLSNQGNYITARLLLERALTISEAALGPGHPYTAESLNNLANLFQAQGDYAAAQPLLERALAIRESTLGPDHLHTAQSLNNLAGLFQVRGDYTAARPLLERALAIRETTLGQYHPDIAASLNNLGLLLQAQGDYIAARPLFERALVIYQAVLGPDHPDITPSLNNLAGLLQIQGEYAAARPLLERALAIREAALGSDHPDTVTSLNNLGLLLQSQGDYTAAQPLFERALAIREVTLGPDHPDIATSLYNLGLLLQSQGDYIAARPLFERALAIFETALGPGHPYTHRVRMNLATLDTA